MEASADGCPTGILIDFENTKDFNIKLSKGNKKDEVYTENFVGEEMKIKSTHLWDVDNIQNQNINPCQFSEKGMYRTPKSKWSTPSPQSMKIISHEVSRIIDRLSTSTDMLCDEVFPAIKSLDDGCFDEYHLKSEIVPITNSFTCEKIPENNLSVNESISVIKTLDDACFNDPHVKSEIVLEADNFSCDKITENSLSVCENIPEINSLVAKYKPSIEKVSSDYSTASNEKQLETPLLSKMIEETKQDFISEEMPENPLLSENASKKESITTLVLNKNSNKKTIYITSAVDLNPTTVEQTEMLEDKHPELEHSLALQVKPSLSVSKGFGFKSFEKRYVDKNKENLIQQAGNKSFVNGVGLSKMEKTSISVEDGFKELKICSKNIKSKPIIKECSRKSIAVLAVSSDNRKGKSVMNASQNYLPKEANGKPSHKSNVYLQPISRSKQPLNKSASMKLETPNVQSVRRSNSFQTRCGKNSIPTVEKKSTSSAISSCSRVLKPRTTLNSASNNGKGLSTPLRFGTNIQKSNSFNSAATNQNRRASGIYFNSDIKAPVPNIRNSTLENPVLSTSSRSRFFSRLDRPSPLPKFMNDNLPRKLF